MGSSDLGWEGQLPVLGEGVWVRVMNCRVWKCRGCVCMHVCGICVGVCVQGCVHMCLCGCVHVCGGVGAQVWSHVPWRVRVSVQGESAETIPRFSQHSLPPSQCTSVSLSLRLLETPRISTGWGHGGGCGGGLQP